MTAAPSPPTDPVWTKEDERAFARRQRMNAGAVTLSSVLSAVAVALGAVLSVVALVGGGDSTEIPTAPIDPLALNAVTESRAGITYETDRIAAVAEAALAEIRYPWRSELQGWSITFLEPRGRASGYTWSAEQRIEVFVRDGDDIARVARVLAHELGHAVDVTLNTPDERRAWLAERGVDSETAWWPGSGRPDFETGAGDFAEVFAAWQVGDDDFKSQVNGSIDEGDYALLESLSLRDS